MATSTYLAYNLVTRDLANSLKQVAAESTVSRDTAYFKANIGKVKTVDDFIKDYRLYSYAMQAYGLSDMTYATSFMKKVLSSDLSDPNSFANKLTDDKYRKFAAAFNFTPATATAESEAQIANVQAAYKSEINTEADQVASDTAYYKATIGTVKTVDDLVNNSRLRSYVLNAFGLPPDNYSTDFLKQVLTSDTSDPSSFVNQLTGSNAPVFQSMARSFSFNTDGTVNGTAQSATNTEELIYNYVTYEPTYKTPTTAQVNDDYFKAKIANVTNVSQITSDPRMFNYIVTALGLPAATLTTTFTNIVESDLTDPNNYATKMGGSTYEAVARMFNFDSSGNVVTGKTAMNDTQLASISKGWFANYNTADNTTMDKLLTSYATKVKTVTSIKDLLSNTTVLNTALKAFGIDPAEVNTYMLTKILESDLADPKSFANTSHDKRFVNLARAFNFDSKGKTTPPLLAQNQSDLTDTARNYVAQKTKYLTGQALKDAQAAAKTDASYYATTMLKVQTASDFLGDQKLVNVVLTANGIDPKSVSKDFLKKVFASDLSDPKSFANTQADRRWAEIVGSFNFDTKGNLTRTTLGTVQQRGSTIETVDSYYRQTLEEEQGNDNQGVRLALYFQRSASKITSATDILADSALLSFVQTTFSLPTEMSNMPIARQADVINNVLNLKDLGNPDKLQKLISRFTAMYDLANPSSQASAADLISGSVGSSISADTLFALSQLKK